VPMRHKKWTDVQRSMSTGLMIIKKVENPAMAERGANGGSTHVHHGGRLTLIPLFTFTVVPKSPIKMIIQLRNPEGCITSGFHSLPVTGDIPETPM